MWPACFVRAGKRDAGRPAAADVGAGDSGRRHDAAGYRAGGNVIGRRFALAYLTVIGEEDAAMAHPEKQDALAAIWIVLLLVIMIATMLALAFRVAAMR